MSQIIDLYHSCPAVAPSPVAREHPSRHGGHSRQSPPGWGSGPPGPGAALTKKHKTLADSRALPKHRVPVVVFSGPPVADYTGSVASGAVPPRPARKPFAHRGSVKMAGNGPGSARYARSPRTGGVHMVLEQEVRTFPYVLLMNSS